MKISRNTILSDDYMIRPATQLDIPDVNRFLEGNFHPEETLLNSLISKLKLTPGQLSKIEVDQRKIITSMVQNHPCQVVVHKGSSKTVAVNVMISSENPNCKDIVDVSPAVRPPELEILVDYFDHMNSMIDQAKLFIKFPNAKRALELYAIAVDQEHRRKGLSTELIKKGTELARNNKFDLIFGLFTSPYSKKAARAAGLRDVLDINLLEFKGKNGDFPFSSCSGEHSTATVMAIMIT